MSHYFINDNSLKSNIKSIKCNINKIDLEFDTDNGVFSKKGIDFGTRSLLESLEEIKGNVLDFGCGYGVIGIYLQKKFNVTVDMVDINERSINLSRRNADLNKADVNVFYSDIYSNVDKEYDYIISNPPIRVGKEILYKILVDAKNYLKPDGKLIFVINKDQGAKSTIKYLANFYNVSVKNKNKGFYIICCSN